LNIIATGIKNGTHYSLSNILGQTLRSGTANASSIKLSAPQSGRYILRLGNSVHPISIK
jgi:endoglucanase